MAKLIYAGCQNRNLQTDLSVKMKKYLKGFNSDLLYSLLWWNLIAITAGLLFLLALHFLDNKKERVKLPFSNSVFVLVICYIISVAAITIIPVPYTEHFKPNTINLVPVANTIENLMSPAKRQSRLLAADVAINILGNILMFMPLGLIIPALFPQINNYKKMAMVAMGLSILIEIIQYFSRLIGNYRQVDIDDVILNTIGALAGYYFYRNYQERKNNPALETGRS